MSDRNVRRVREILTERSQAGLTKYGVTTERTDIDLLGWLRHLQEELLDAAVYVERLKLEAVRSWQPGNRIRLKENRKFVRVLRERKADDSGWWLTDTSGLCDEAAAEAWELDS